MELREVSIEVCGRLAVTVGGRRRESDLPGRQGRLALAHLALNRSHPVSRERLIGALWGDDAGPGHAQPLNVILSKLRRALGAGVIETAAEGGVQLAPAVRVDFEEAEAALGEALEQRRRGDWHAVAKAAARTIELADAQLLPGYEASWLEEPRRRLEELGLQARELRAAAGLRLGGADVAPAERAAQEVIERAPFRESGYLLLMRLHEAEGNVAEALRLYERLRSLLREELGVTPGPQLQREFERLLNADRATSGEAEATSSPAAATAPPAAPAMQGAGFFATRRGAGFVGRRDELERLRTYFHRAAEGRRQLVLLEGEPGVGKTRLMLECIAGCETEGALALYGRCDAETLVPYQPFVEALRRYVARAPQERIHRWCEQYGAELSGVVPELARRADAADTARRAAEDADRFGLFQAVSDVLTDIARCQPVVLVLDDLHWADKPTMLMLRQIVRSSDDAPLLLIGSFRDSERPAQLVEMLAQIRREHFFDRISLRGLGVDDATAMIQDFSSRAVPAGVSRVLWEESRGNPFFLEEMLRDMEASATWADAGPSSAWDLQRRLPEGIREVIGRRLASLSDTTRDVLSVSAVVGREFAIDLLEALGTAEDDLDRVVDEGVAAHVITEVPGAYGRCSFTHSLIRQALYEGLTATRRARLHLRIAETIERLTAGGGDPPLAELAHHFLLSPPARGAAKAVEYAERAARAATGVLAHEEAARLYAVALDALERLGEDPDRRCALLLGLGDAQTKSGDVARARKTFERAGEIARTLGSAPILAQAALGYGNAGQMAGGVVDRRVVELLEEAIEAVGSDHLPLRARLLARLAIELSFSDQRQRRAALSAEAVKLAHRAGDLSGLGFAHVARHWSLWGPGNVTERLASANDLLHLAELTGDDRLATLGHRWRMIDLLELGDIEGVDVELDAHARLVARRRRLADAPYVEIYRAMRLLLAGEFDEAEAASHEALRLGERIGDTNAGQAHVLQMVALRRERGGLDGIMDIVSDHAGRYSAIPGWRCVLASLHAQTGHPEQARATLEDLGAEGFRGLPLDGIWLGAIATLAETAWHIGDSTHAATLHELLEPYAERNVAIGWASACAGSASRYLALLATLLGDNARAIAHFESALEMNARMGARPLVARTQVELAALILETDPRADRARVLVEPAVAEARRLGMPRVLADGEALLDPRSTVRRFERSTARSPR